MPLDLTQLLHLIEEIPAYRQLVAGLEPKNSRSRVAVLDAAKPYLIAALYQSRHCPILMVTAQPENSQKLYEQLSVWCASSQVKRFPEPDALPYERITSDNSSEIERLQVLSALTNTDDGGETATTAPPLIITSAPALMQKTAPYRDFTGASHTLMVGKEAEPFQLLSQWQAMGYRLENTVELPGMMSHRGGIIDIYPPTSDLPARLEFMGNTVDSIRLFDPANQRSLKSVSSLAVTPATERLSSTRNDELLHQDSLLDYLPPDGILILDEPQHIKEAMTDLETKADELRAEKSVQGEVLPDTPRPYFTWEELEPAVQQKQCLVLSGWGITEHEAWSELNFTPAPSYAGRLPLLVKKAGEMLAQKQRLIIVSHQASRLSELLGEADILAPPLTEVSHIPPRGSLTLVQGLLGEGWVMNGDTCLLTDTEIFGFTKQRRLLKKRPVARRQLFVDITPGNYVVHVEHGIARFTGVITMSNDSTGKEYLVLEYAAGDKLYVPT
ncbi:MAG: hypothetical protein HY663_01215, partial [Chloroflexi bacterium]|nr:hypothetical protein [Chloroflexota bacterium]